MSKKYSVSSFNLADYDETYTFQLSHPAMSNSLTTKEGQPILFPPSVTISAVDRILYPNEDGYLEERTIAFRPGQSTVFVADGEDLQSLNENRTKSLGDIEFIHGFLRVSKRQPQLLEFLRLCNKNGTNINRDKNVTVSFFEVNHEAAIKSIMDNEERDIEIITFCTKGDYETVRSVAMALGINVNQPVIQVRYDLRTYAMRSEETKSTFMRALKSPSVKRKSIVMDAIQNEILYINRANNSLNWTDGTNILAAPMGKDPVDYFVDNSFNNNSGEMTYAEIQRQVEELKAPKHNPIAAPKFAIDVKNEVNESEEYSYDDLIKSAKKAGIIEVRGAYIRYDGMNYKKADFIDMLKSDKSVYNEIKGSAVEN